MTPTASDLAILRFLAGQAHATVPAIGGACRLSPNELRPRLAAMASHRLVGSRMDAAERPPVRVAYDKVAHALHVTPHDLAKTPRL